MLFKRAFLDGIAAGAIRLAFRRWRKPTVKAGTELRTAIGTLRIEAVEAIEEQALTDADAKAAGFADHAALLADLREGDGRTLYRISLGTVGADHRIALRGQARLTEADAEALLSRFARWEKRAPGYHRAILDGIARQPATAAALLAGRLRVDKARFKQDVRKLKALGLTESLDIGYRLSPRGEALLRMLDGSTAEDFASRP